MSQLYGAVTVTCHNSMELSPTMPSVGSQLARMQIRGMRRPQTTTFRSIAATRVSRFKSALTIVSLKHGHPCDELFRQSTYIEQRRATFSLPRSLSHITPLNVFVIVFLHIPPQTFSPLAQPARSVPSHFVWQPTAYRAGGGG